MSIEDIVDLLTLKDNEAKFTDFATALELLTRAQVCFLAHETNTFHKSSYRTCLEFVDFQLLEQCGGASISMMSMSFQDFRNAPSQENV